MQKAGNPDDLLGVNGGERQHEDRPFTHFALHGDGAMVGFHNFFYDGEAETMPTRIPGASRVGPVKRLEEMRQVFAGNPLPGVSNRDLYLILGAAEA